MKNIFWFLMLITFTTGCATSYNNDFDAKLLASMNTWRGYHISQLIEQIGPYSHVHSDGADGKIYTWQIDPHSLPPITPLRQYRSSTVNSAITQAASQNIYQQRLQLRQKCYQ